MPPDIAKGFPAGEAGGKKKHLLLRIILLEQSPALTEIGHSPLHTPNPPHPRPGDTLDPNTENLAELEAKSAKERPILPTCYSTDTQDFNMASAYGLLQIRDLFCNHENSVRTGIHGSPLEM